MAMKIAVAGATGDLGGRILAALLAQGADAIALVRTGTAGDRIDKLEALGVQVAIIDMSSVDEIAGACAGASCVVSALAGLRDVIVDAQAVLLDAAIAAGVSHFIPSDFSSDFMQMPAGANRNFDLRRAFHERLAGAPIGGTSILNGAFMDMLINRMPLIDFGAKRVSYWQNADQRLDFTTMDNTAAYTAAAALDPSAPRVLRCAGAQISARELAVVASEVTGTDFELVNLGTLDLLAARIQHDRAADPESENQLYPRWQGMQYMYGMFSGLGALDPLDNDRYPNIRWTGVRELLSLRFINAAAGAAGH